MTEIIGFQKWKRKEKKNIYIYYCESISFEDSPAHISTRAPSVWYVPLPYDRATWSPKTQHPPPDPSHNTEIHGPQRQDVQKLVFNIKQCRPYCKQLSHPPTPFLLLLCKVWAYMKDGQSPPLQNDRKTKRRTREEAENIRTEHRSSLCIIHFFSFFFLNTLIHAKFNQSTKRTVKNSFSEKKHDWTLDSWFLCCRLVTRETKGLGGRGGEIKQQQKRSIGPTGGGRLWEVDPVGVISWPWWPWLNFAEGWPASLIPFLPQHRKDIISYLLASESVRWTKK